MCIPGLDQDISRSYSKYSTMVRNIVHSSAFSLGRSAFLVQILSKNIVELHQGGWPSHRKTDLQSASQKWYRTLQQRQMHQNASKCFNFKHLKFKNMIQQYKNIISPRCHRLSFHWKEIEISISNLTKTTHSNGWIFWWIKSWGSDPSADLARIGPFTTGLKSSSTGAGFTPEKKVHFFGCDRAVLIDSYLDF